MFWSFWCFLVTQSISAGPFKLTIPWPVVTIEAWGWAVSFHFSDVERGVQPRSRSNGSSFWWPFYHAAWLGVCGLKPASKYLQWSIGKQIVLGLHENMTCTWLPPPPQKKTWPLQWIVCGGHGTTSHACLQKSQPCPRSLSPHVSFKKHFTAVGEECPPLWTLLWQIWVWPTFCLFRN